MVEEVTMLLRIHPGDSDHPWRARLEDIRTRTELVFTDPAALARYLEQLRLPRPPPAGLR